MTSFAALRLPREILFGKGQRHALPVVARKLGSRALVCTDERFAATTIFAEIIASLKAADIDVLVHNRVLPDVPRDTVAVCVEEASGFLPDMVIGIGNRRVTAPVPRDATRDPASLRELGQRAADLRARVFVVGVGLHVATLAQDALHELLERLAVPLLEGRPLALAVV